MFAARSCISWLDASAGSDGLMPSSALLLTPSDAVTLLGRGGALVGLDPLPLAVHVRRRPCLRVAEHVRMAAHDLGRDGRLHVGEVEYAGLRRELRVEHDLQQQVAELLGEVGRRAGIERVVDLVRLLEQMLAERGVGLLAIPRAAVGSAQAVRDPGHRPRPAEGELRRDRPHVERCREGLGRQLADRRPVGQAETAHRVIGGVEPAEHRERVAAGGSVPAGERLDGAAVVRRAERRQRHEEERAGCLDGRRDEALGRDDLETGGKVEPPAQPCLGDQGVEHRPRRSPGPGR